MRLYVWSNQLRVLISYSDNTSVRVLLHRAQLNCLFYMYRDQVRIKMGFEDFRTPTILTQTFLFFITKTCLYNFDPLKPHFYIVKLGYTGYILFFIVLLKNIDCGYSLEPPRRGGSNEYPQSMCWAEIWKISEFLSEFFHFLVVKFSIYLNRRVFVMWYRIYSKISTRLTFYQYF